MHPHSKGGRPPLPPDSVRGRSVTVKFSGDEFARIRSAAAKAEVPVSVFVREAALRGRVFGRVTEEEKQTVDGLRMNLRNIGVNINTIARQAGFGITQSVRQELFGHLARLSSLADTYEEKLRGHGGSHQ